MVNNELEKYMLDFGYSKNDMQIIINSYPFVELKDETKLNNIKNINNFFLSLGLQKEEIINCSVIFPNIYTFSIQNLENKIKDLITLGYSKEDTIKIGKECPNIYGHSIENIKSKLKNKMKLGYSYKEIIKIFKCKLVEYGAMESIKNSYTTLVGKYTKMKGKVNAK